MTERAGCDMSDTDTESAPWWRQVRVDDLCLGATNPKKVIHHRGCPHARTDYLWARRQGSVQNIAIEMYANGSWRWHRCCQSCCGDLDDALRHLGVYLDG